MQDLKRIFKNSLKTSVGVLIYGLVMRSEIIYMGMFIGSLISVLALYMMTMEAKKIIYSNSPKKIAILGYLKRYILYGLFLGIMSKYYGLPMLIGSATGLLNVKINISLITLSENIKKYMRKHFNQEKKEGK